MASSGAGRVAVGGGVAALAVALKVGLRLARVAADDHTPPESSYEASVGGAHPAPVRFGRYEPAVSDPSRQIVSHNGTATLGSGVGPFVAHLKVDDDGKVIDVKGVTTLNEGILIAARRIQFSGGAGEFDVTWSE